MMTYGAANISVTKCTVLIVGDC